MVKGLYRKSIEELEEYPHEMKNDLLAYLQLLYSAGVTLPEVSFLFWLTF